MIRVYSHLLSGVPHIFCTQVRTSDWSPGFLLYVQLESIIIREFPVLSFDQWTKTCHIQSELLHNVQSGCIMLTNQAARLEPIRSVRIWIPHLHKMDLIGTLGRNFHFKRWLSLCLAGTQFRLLTACVLVSLRLQLLLLK